MGAVWDDPRIAAGMARQLELRRGWLAEGDRAMGWKVAFGSPEALEHTGLEGPVVGFLTSRALVEPGATYSIAGWTKPAFEPEVAVHMARDLGADASRETTRTAIGALGPAIELADIDRPRDEVERVVAENAYQRGVILGPADEARAGADVVGLRARITCDGAEIAATDDPTSLTGDPVDIVRHVADLLAAFGETLRAGEVVITGSVVPLIWPSPGRRYEYELEPLGRLSVTFSA